MMMGKGCGLHKVALVLLVIGGINWGLVGAFSYNLVDALFGAWPVVVRVVYVLVGLSALAMLGYGKCCGNCEKK